MSVGQGDSKLNPTIKLNNIPVNNTPFESPKRVSAFKTVQFKSTAITKSPLSKIFQDMEPLFQPSLFKTPRPGLFEQMVYLKTPDNRFTNIQGKLAEKLDFDDLGGSAKKEQEIIERDQQLSQYDCSYDNADSNEQASQQEVQIKKIQIPANISWQSNQPVLSNKTTNFVYNPNFITETQSTKICCNCKKSRCLKLYCQCFRNNQVCSGCNCVACLNTDEHNPERYKAFVAMIEANPQAFCPKIQSQKHTKGCHCKKSNCQKKYCECYQAGLPCSQLCRCQDCKNTDGSHCNQKSTPSKTKVKPKMIEG